MMYRATACVVPINLSTDITTDVGHRDFYIRDSISSQSQCGLRLESGPLLSPNFSFYPQALATCCLLGPFPRYNTCTKAICGDGEGFGRGACRQISIAKCGDTVHYHSVCCVCTFAAIFRFYLSDLECILYLYIQSYSRLWKEAKTSQKGRCKCKQ